MAYREVTMIEVKEVLRQWLSGRSRKATSRWTGLDRNTIRRYIRIALSCGLRYEDGEAGLTDEKLSEVIVALGAGPGRPQGDGWSVCEAHRDVIASLIGKRIRLTKVHKLLLRQGIVVTYPTLHRFAYSELGFGKGRLTIPVNDCAPGEELQVDTGLMGMLEPGEDGRRRRFKAFIFTSVCTRHRFVYPCLTETTADAIAACEAAWAFFGGIFRVLIPDNTKAIVSVPDPLDPTLNPTFQEYAQHRSFFIDPTRVRAPQDKGRVERAVQPTRDDCFAGEKLHSLEDARRRAHEWCTNEYGMRRHSTTQRLPLEHFTAEEKGVLREAPADVYEVPLRATPKVHRDQHAAVAKALYSLPRAFVGKTLEAVATRTTVCFYDGRTLVKVHARKSPGGRSTDPHDFPAEQAAYAMRDMDFLKRQAQEQGEAVGRFADGLLAGPLPWTRMRRVFALLGLCRRYGSARVEEACGKALAIGMVDVKRLRRVLDTGPAPSLSAGADRVIPIARYLRPSSQYALLPAKRGESSHDKGDHA
jgi:hypothetical protein